MEAAAMFETDISNRDIISAEISSDPVGQDYP